MIWDTPFRWLHIATLDKSYPDKTPKQTFPASLGQNKRYHFQLWEHPVHCPPSEIIFKRMAKSKQSTGNWSLSLLFLSPFSHKSFLFELLIEISSQEHWAMISPLQLLNLIRRWLLPHLRWSLIADSQTFSVTLSVLWFLLSVNLNVQSQKLWRKVSELVFYPTW